MRKREPKEKKSIEDWEKEIELVDDSSQQAKAEGFPEKQITSKTASFLTTYKWIIFHVFVVSGILYQFGKVWQLYEISIILSGIYLIAMNFGEKEKGKLSAYSIFNKNFEKPIGSFQDPYARYGYQQEPQNGQRRANGNEESDNSDTEEDKRNLYWFKKSKYSNKNCYCGSNQKYKRCCLPHDKKFFNG